MKKVMFLAILLWFSGALTIETKALPAKMVSGQLLIGGTSYGTNDHQTYIRFLLTARTSMPRRDFVMDAVQPFSVYLNHPIQPNGDYQYRVVMPYGAQRLMINGEFIAPVWYEECVWTIKSSVFTPNATLDSPQFIFVTAPFTMSGSTVTFGAYMTGFKFNGSGTVRIKFEKNGTKYYLLEALYNFGGNPFFNEKF